MLDLQERAKLAAGKKMLVSSGPTEKETAETPSPEIAFSKKELQVRKLSFYLHDNFY